MTATSFSRPIGEQTPAAGRAARLATGMRALRTRADSETLQNVLLIVGGILMPLGVLFIVLGWVGASRTPLPFEQNDYLISGGILGLALVVGGGFTYFSFWQTVRIRESRVQAAELTAALGRVESLLRGGPGAPVSGGPAADSQAAAGSGTTAAVAAAAAAAAVAAMLPGGGSASAGSAAPAAAYPAHAFVATSSGSMFHRRDCATVAGRTDVQDVDPAITTLKPCRICSPLEG